jgi:transposase
MRYGCWRSQQSISDLHQFGRREPNTLILLAEIRISVQQAGAGFWAADITVYSSDGKRPAGNLSRQGPQLLRWALYESAKCAARPSAPDHGYYTAARDRRNAGLATLPVARKLARRCYHTLRELGEEALTPAA